MLQSQTQLDNMVRQGRQPLAWLASWFQRGLQLTAHSRQTNNSAHLYEHLR